MHATACAPCSPQKDAPEGRVGRGSFLSILGVAIDEPADHQINRTVAIKITQVECGVIAVNHFERMAGKDPGTRLLQDHHCVQFLLLTV